MTELTRNTAQQMSKEELKPFILKELNYKDFNICIFKCFNGYRDELNANVYYNDKYIDYVLYPDYVVNIHGDLNAYIEYINRTVKIKLFNLEDLKSIDNYSDFKNKYDYVWNIYDQVVDGVSTFNDNANKGAYKFYSEWHYFKNLETAKHYEKVKTDLFNLYKDSIQNNDEFLYKACVHEFYDHESPIDWDGMEPALNSLGINYKTLSSDKRAIVDKAYNYCCTHGSW